MTNFYQAPLPFTGQKRQFIKHYVKVLSENIAGDGSGWTIIDAFGGSGLLSHHAKCAKPGAHVIYNDFDSYIKRLQHIPDTNRLRQQLFGMLSDVPRHKIVPKDLKESIINVLNTYNGYIDIDCAQAWLLFSGQQVESLNDLCSKSMYNCIRTSDYPIADGYLAGVEVVQKSYVQLLPEYLNRPKTLLVLDPPYVNTKQGAYRQAAYFGMIEFLRLMQFVRPPFIFFSSTRSEFKAYLDFIIDSRTGNYQNFIDTTCISINARLNGSSAYEDNLIYRF